MRFGPSKKEIWSQFAKELGGEFVKGKGFKADKVIAAHGDWIIVFDTIYRSTGQSNIPYTRLRAPYVNRDDFVFEITRKNVFSGIGKLLGMQDVEVGHTFFDREFIIKGNDERKLTMFFENEHIRQLIQKQPRITLKIFEDRESLFAPKFPGNINMVYFEAMGRIKDLDQLHDLYELFAETLEQLHNIGTAWEDRPGMIP